MSIRCKIIVRDVLEKLCLDYSSVELGEINIDHAPPAEGLAILKKDLAKCGLELLDNKRSIIIEKIKTVIVEMIHYSDKLPSINFSDYISRKLQYDYTYLSNLFSEVKGISIRQFIIQHKIERVKELLTYNELNLTEIAKLMQYSSVGHLANQFKKVTSLTTSHFKHIQEQRRQCLEDM